MRWGGRSGDLQRPAFALAGYAGTAFAHFATREPGVACPAVAREASEGWWSQAGSNRRPLACHASALPAELWPRNLSFSTILAEDHAALRDPGDSRARTLIIDQGRSQVSSSPPTSPMMSVTSSSPSSSSAMKVEIVVIIVFDGLVDLDVVLELRHDRLHLAGLLLGIGFLERHQLFGLRRLRRDLGGAAAACARAASPRTARGGATGAIGTTSPV